MAPDRDAPPPERPLRLFLAVDLPTHAKDGLETVVAPFRSAIPGARWTRRDGWHVTVKFLGATWARLLPAVEEGMRAAAREAAPVPSRLTELGSFPTATRARVLWAGLEDPDGRLAALAGRLDELLEESFVPEDRAFHPHLTVARLVPPRNLREFAPTFLGTRVDSEPFAVDGLVLYRSHLSPAGARYEPLLNAPFGGA